MARLSPELEAALRKIIARRPWYEYMNLFSKLVDAGYAVHGSLPVEISIPPAGYAGLTQKALDYIERYFNNRCPTCGCKCKTFCRKLRYERALNAS